MVRVPPMFENCCQCQRIPHSCSVFTAIPILLIPDRTPVANDDRQDPARPFRCGICSMRFTRRTHLNRHVIGHSSVRQYECDLCHRKFHRKDNLRMHLERHGVVTKKPEPAVRNPMLPRLKIEEGTEVVAPVAEKQGPRTKLCPICGKNFGRAYHLNRHLRLHATKPEYFARQSRMVDHVTDLVTGADGCSKKIVRCTICDRGFGRSYHLKRHMKQHGIDAFRPAPSKADKIA